MTESDVNEIRFILRHIQSMCVGEQFSNMNRYESSTDENLLFTATTKNPIKLV